jgi:hypothetical protein
MYRGTNIFIGPVQPELELAVVGFVVAATVAGLVVAAVVAGLVVAGFDVPATVGLEAEGAVAELVVVGAEEVGAAVELVVAGAVVVGAAVDVPEYVTPVSTIPTEAEVMMLATVSCAPFTEVSRTDNGNLNLEAEDTVK